MVAIPLPDALQIEPAGSADGLPLLRGQLPAPQPVALTLVLHIHNSAGIPIIGGQARLAAGDQTLLFADLRPIGIDAYAHASPAQRAQIAARIWTRRAYGTLQLRPNAG